MAGIEVSGGALLIALAGYLLKNWWDRQNELRDRRDNAYFSFLKNVQTLHDALKGFTHIEMSDDEIIKKMDEALPDIYVFGSDRILEASIEFFECATDVLRARKSGDESEISASRKRLSVEYKELVEKIRIDVQGFSVGALVRISKSKLKLKSIQSDVEKS